MKGLFKFGSMVALLMVAGLQGMFAQAALSEVESHLDLKFAEIGGKPLLLDLHLPKGLDKPPLVMFIHGGSWRAGSRKRCKLDWVVSHGFAVASIDYRFSQQALFPAQIHDCKGALRWLRAHAGEYGYDASNVIVAGSSAGGHLAALMGTSGGVAELEGTTGGNLEQSSRVQGVMDYYGPTDFVLRSKTHPAKTETPDGSVFQLLGGKVSENLDAARAASPITYVTKDDPPLLILHGANDTTVKMDQTEVFRDRYQAEGLEVNLYIEPNGKHGWSPVSDLEKAQVLESLRRWSGK